MRHLISALGLLLGVSSASAQSATLTLPSVTFTSPPSTSITCSEIAAASLVVPVAANTAIFTCTVSPSTWSGAITGTLSAPFAVSGLAGNSFKVVNSTAITAPGTIAPGTVTAVP